MKLKVAYISKFLEYPAHGGPQLRVENTIKVLSQVCDLHLISLSSIDFVGGSSAMRYFQSLTPFFTFAESVAPGLPYKIKSVLLGRKSNTEWLKSYLIENEINILWISYANLEINLIKELRSAIPSLKIIGDTDSVWSRFVSRGEKYRGKNLTKEVSESIKTEMELCKLCNVVTAVSKVDANYYQKISSYAKIMLFPNLIDISVKNKYSTSKLHSEYVLLPGSFGPDSPMNDAADWLCNEIMPLVWKKIPNLQLIFAGNNSDQYQSKKIDSRIIRTGRISDLSYYFTNALAVLVPLRFESGTRYKILEAGKYCKPVISTKLGAEGLEIINNFHYLMADTTDAFAKSIIKTITSKVGNRISKNLEKFVKQNNSTSNGKLFAHNILKNLL